MDEAERLSDHVAIMDHGKIIALGTPRELIASLGADHVVEFALKDGAEPNVDALGTLRGVRSVRVAGGTWTLEVGAAHEAVPALLAYIDRSQFGLTELRTHSPTLDDVFVSLTGRTLRDGP